MIEFVIPFFILLLLLELWSGRLYLEDICFRFLLNDFAFFCFCLATFDFFFAIFERFYYDVANLVILGKCTRRRLQAKR